MVFVFKDFHRQPYHINTIPVESLENVKEWLDSGQYPILREGPLNLNWPTIMKTVTADTHQFFVDGGWSFLQTETDDEDGEEEVRNHCIPRWAIANWQRGLKGESRRWGQREFDGNASAGG